MHKDLDLKNEVEYIRDIEKALLKQRLEDEKETVREIEDFQLNEFMEANNIWVSTEGGLNYARQQFYNTLMAR